MTNGQNIVISAFTIVAMTLWMALWVIGIAAFLILMFVLL